MPGEPIYLDHNATSPILPEAADAMREAAVRYHGNPASQHHAGRQARRALEQARTRIAELLGARTTGMDADQLVFTSGGTESNNSALRGLTQGQPSQQPRPSLVGASGRPRLVVSAIEHPSVSRTAEALESTGIEVETLGVDSHGVIRLDQLEALFTPATRLTSLMLASNETGVIQPIAEAAALCHRQGVLLHTDATQAVGKLAVSFTDLGVDALTATAHKFHGPVGVGVLVLRHGVQFAPMLQGGFQQAALRPGTEAVALAAGMQTALEFWQRDAEARRQRMSDLRNRLEEALLAGWPETVVVGRQSPRLPHTSNVALVGLNRQALVMALDLAGVACSSGSACASGSSEPSPTLLAMGLLEEQISSSVRFSLGATTTLAEIDDAARRILNVCNNLRREE